MAAEQDALLSSGSLDVYDQLVKYIESLFSQLSPDVSSYVD